MTKKETIFYQYSFCIKMLLMQQAQITIELARRKRSSLFPLTIRKIRAIRGVKHFTKTTEFSEQFGDIINMFKLANIFVYTKGNLYCNPTILCMEVQQGLILTENEIIAEGKNFYEQTLLPYVNSLKSNQKIKLHIEKNDILSELVE